MGWGKLKMGFYGMLKANARRAMAGGWGKAVAVLVIGLVPVALIRLLEQGLRMVFDLAFYDASGQPSLALASTVVTLLMGALVWAILAPLRQGISRWFYLRTAAQKEPVTAVFHYFETPGAYGKALGLQLSIAVRMLLWGILLALPLGAARWFWEFYLRRAGVALPPFAGLLFSLLVWGWTVLAAILLIFLALRYQLAPYLLAEHPDWKIRQTVRQGVRFSRGQRGGLFTFGLSFIGWFLPLLAAIGGMVALQFVHPLYRGDVLAFVAVMAVIQLLISLYARPYWCISFAMYGRYLIQRGEREQALQAGEDLTREYEAGSEPSEG